MDCSLRIISPIFHSLGSQLPAAEASGVLLLLHLVILFPLEPIRAGCTIVRYSETIEL